MEQIQLVNWDEEAEALYRKLQYYVKTLQDNVPKNGLQQPLALVNIDRLVKAGLDKSLDIYLNHPPEGLYFQISYLEGLPTIFGVPIWEKLEDEPLEYYNLFKRYRLLLDEKGSRSIFKLHLESGIPARHLELLRNVYSWKMRTEAYDAYMEHEQQVITQQAQIMTLGKHRKVANQIFDRCSDYILSHSEELSPRTALQWAEFAVKLQRMSLGLQPDKSGYINENTPQITIQNNVASGTSNAAQISTGDTAEDKVKLKQLLNVMSNVGVLTKEESVNDSLQERTLPSIEG